MRKIACTDYPFKKADKEEQITAEVKFMKKLASRMTVPEHCISGRPVVTHLTSTRLRDVILYNKEYEPALYEKMKGSIEALSLSFRQRTTRTMRFLMYLSPAKIGKIP